MPAIIDPISKLAIGDPRRLPLLLTECPSHQSVLQALDSCILSASGWRAVFAASGNEEDFSGEVSPPFLILAAAMARVFADGLTDLCPTKIDRYQIVVGCDSRPTGDLLA